MNDDAVSLVVPLRDGARHVAAALASARAQTIPPAEILVVDDGSTDDGPAIAAALGARVLASPRRGAGPARNAGAAAARGPWLAVHDADDLWLPRRLEAGLAAARGAPRDVHVFGAIRQFFDPEIGRTDRPAPEVSSAPHADTLLVRVDVFRADGGLPEDGALGEFVAWYAGVVDRGRPVISLPETLAERRLHGRNTGVLRGDDRASYARALKAVLDRRRAAGTREASP